MGMNEVHLMFFVAVEDGVRTTEEAAAAVGYQVPDGGARRFLRGRWRSLEATIYTESFEGHQLVSIGISALTFFEIKHGEHPEISGPEFADWFAETARELRTEIGMLPFRLHQNEPEWPPTIYEAVWFHEIGLLVDEYFSFLYLARGIPYEDWLGPEQRALNKQGGVLICDADEAHLWVGE
ncbi:hypothetical protein IMZ11_17890 [Microtetraspora sp. AC03309]|uniref:hypothetical protein n=1 Tax=Microtetraspora sp. AC03309 TaxID=2779376 RepID=UPI001E5EDB6A|nr:hypothetical protein [Microtetraspora sp. AC03309]MCC5577499.1 hypothetical protein [Microtetraspora sp. AC03309]